MINEISTEDMVFGVLDTIKQQIKRSDKVVYNSEVERCFIQLVEAIKNMETK
jgi:hypothetical protein